MQDNFGLNLDHHPDDANVGEWVKARNVVVSKKYHTVSAEKGAVAFGVDDNVGQICGIIPTDEGHIEFETNGSTVNRILRVLHDGSFTVVINDPLLGLSMDNPVRGVYQRNYAGDLVISFWEGLGETANRPRILNLDCLPFDLDGNQAFINPEDINLLYLYPPISNARVDLDEVLDSGGVLTTGVYYIYMAYEFGDGSRTVFFGGSNPITVHDDHTNQPFTQIDGADPGSSSNKSIKVTFNNLDTIYPKLSIAIVSKIGGVVSAVYAASLRITGTSLTWVYTGNQLISDLTLSEVIVPYQTYDRVHTGTVHEGRLYLYNLRTEAAPDIQKYVNNIKLKWVADDELNISNYAGSYKNPNNVFYFRGFRTFAVYGFYLIVHTDNGQKWTYHIPGRDIETVNLAGAGVVDEDDIIADILAAGATDPDITEAANSFGSKAYYQIFDTSRADGTLGVWHNRDEFYEDVDCNDIVDCSSGSDVIVGTLRNKRVRHHRIPSTALLNSVYTDILDAPATPPILFDLDVATSEFKHSGGLAPWGSVEWNIGTDNTSGWGTLETPSTYGVREFVFSRSALVTIRLKFRVTNVDDFLDVAVAFSRQDGAAFDFTYVIDESIDLPITDNNYTYDSGDIYYVFRAEVGDKLWWDVRYSTNAGGGQADFDNVASYFEVLLLEPDAYDTSSKIVGIQLEDLCIPEALRERIIGYELAYAERTPANQVVFDQDVIKYKEANVFRSHPFDSLLLKTSAQTDFIRTYYEFTGERPFIYGARTVSSVLKEVMNTKYIPTDVTIPIENKLREEILFGSLVNPFTVTPAVEPPDIYLYDALYFVDFIRVLDNVYINRLQQDIVRTGFVYDYATLEAGGFTIYGGDTFRSLYGVQLTPSLNNEFDEDHQIYRLKNLYPVIYPVESVANIGLRHSDFGKFYYPHDAVWDNDIPEDPDVLAVVNQTTNGMLYNSDYSSVNNIEVQVVFECRDGCFIRDLIRFPTRIHRSIDTGREEYNPGWRVFLTNSYFEMPKDRGDGQVLKSFQRKLMIQNEFALYVANGNDILLGSSLEVSIGRGDLFTSEPDEIIPDEGGYIGCGSQWGAIVSPIGYVVVDNSTEGRGKVFVYNGSSPNEISAAKVRFFLRDNLYTNGIDNPFKTSGVTLVYDDENKRIIIGKHLLVINNEGNPLSGFQAITMSYSIEYQRWICLHDYTPNYLFSTRNGVYSVFNNVTGQVFKHNAPNVFGFYYHDTGLPVPCYVDFIIPNKDETADVLDSVVWKSRVTDSNGKVLYDETITSIMLYTDDQCTGLIHVSPKAILPAKVGDIRHNEYLWTFGNLRDAVVSRNALFINEDGSLVSANLNLSKPFFKKSKFICTFVIVRMHYNNVNQRRIDFVFTDVVKTKSLR